MGLIIHATVDHAHWMEPYLCSLGHWCIIRNFIHGGMV